MAGRPILPRSDADPLGTSPAERKAMADFARRLRVVRGLYRDLLDRIDFLAVNAVRYEFLTDPAVLSNLLTETGRLVDDILLQGGERDLWFLSAYVEPAYRRGTAQQFANLGAQSQAYARSRGALSELLLSQPYQRRIGLIRARQFELMSGFTASTRQQMAQVLTQGLATGIGPRAIAKNLTAQIGVEQSRAERIARTEIGNALRQARLDESQQAETDLGIKTLELHVSALQVTTRPTHAARNGTLHTAQEQKEWWAQPGFSVNCKCSTIAVLVDADGNPLTPGIVERVRAKRDTQQGT